MTPISRVARKAFFLTALLLSLGLSAAVAQLTTGTILGTVTDPAGAAVAKASIAATNTGTNIRATATTGSSGEYTISELQIGIYEVEVTAPGFKTFKQLNVNLTANENYRVDAHLILGQINQTVEVAANTEVLQTDASDLNTVVNAKIIANMPNIGRNPMMALLAVPGLMPLGSFQDMEFATGDTARGQFANFSINGARPISSEITMDGSPNTSTAYNEIAIVPSMASVGELKVETNAFSAEYGRTTSGVVQFLTKSGGNAFHGSLFEYFRNSALNANTFANNSKGRNSDGTLRAPVPIFDTNQFGGSLEGPVLIPKLYNGRSKTFFFFSYEGQRRRVGVNSFYTVPTALERQGDFSQSLVLVNGKYIPRQISLPLPQTSTVVYAPGSTVNYYILRQPLPNGQIPTQYMNSLAKQMMTWYPLPNVPANPDGTLNYFDSDANRDAPNQVSLKIDQNFGQNHRIFGRFTMDSSSSTPANLFSSTNPSANSSQPVHQFVPSLNLGYTWSISPTMILDWHGTVTRLNLVVLPPTGSNADFASLGFAPNLIALSPNQIFPILRISNYPSMGLGQYAAENNHNTNTATNVTITKVHDKWTLKFGGEYRVYLSNFDQPNVPSLYFNSTSMTGPCYSHGYACPTSVPQAGSYAPADALLGGFDGGLGNGQFASGDPAYALKNSYMGFFSQNDWKATRKLTINVGVRYEVAPTTTERYNRMSQFDPYLTNITGTMGEYTFAGVNGNSRTQTNTNYNNIAPRAGLAYRLGSKTVIRTGYGIFYDVNTGFGSGSQRFGPDGFNAQAFMYIRPQTGPQALADILQYQFTNAPTSGGQVIGPNPTDPRYLGTAVNMISRNAPSPSGQQWNFTIQRDFSVGDHANMIATVAYVGTKGTHTLLGSRDENNVIAIPQATIQSARAQWIATGTNPLTTQVPNPFYGKIPNGTIFLAPTISQQQLDLPFPAYASALSFQDDIANSSYNAVQGSIVARLRSGMTFTANYTFSKNIDDGGAISNQNFGGGSSGFDIYGWYNYRLDRAVSSNDAPHRFVGIYTWDLPFGKGHSILGNTPVLNQVVAHWVVSGLTQFQSGFPLTINGAGGWSGRPDLVENPVLPKQYRIIGDGVTPTTLPDGNTIVVPAGRELYFNPDAFRSRVVAIANTSISAKNPGLTNMVADQYYWGDSPRNYPWLRGYGINNTDLSVRRSFALKEKTRLDVKVDARNAGNHTQISGNGGLTTSMGTTIGSTYTSGDWTTLSAAQQAKFGYTNSVNFGSFLPGSATYRQPRYLQVSLTLSF